MITIVGAPESGASLLARALFKLGADVGIDPGQPLSGPDSSGAFEYAPVLNLDRDVLIALGGTWSTPPPFPPGWVDGKLIAPLRERAQEISGQLPERMIVSDPRLSFVQPLWERVGSVPSTILSLRHPMAVASSLQAEHGLSLDHALFLWFRYSAAAMLNRPDSFIVEHEGLLSEPEEQLSRITEHLALEVNPRILSATTRTLGVSAKQPSTFASHSSPIATVCLRLYGLLKAERPLEDDEAVFLWARLATELPWGGPGDVDVRRARREVIEQGVNVARLTRANEEKERRLLRLTLEVERMRRAMDEMAFREAAGVIDTFQNQGLR